MQQYMSFSEYVKQEMNKTFNKQDVAVSKAVNPAATPTSMKTNVDPKTWNAKIIGDKKYLFFGGKHLDVSELKKAIQKIYSENGYEHYGFSKLGETELVRYKTVRDILLGEFIQDDNSEALDPTEIAQLIFDNEVKDFTWQPAPVTI